MELENVRGGSDGLLSHRLRTANRKPPLHYSIIVKSLTSVKPGASVLKVKTQLFALQEQLATRRSCLLRITFAVQVL